MTNSSVTVYIKHATTGLLAIFLPDRGPMKKREADEEGRPKVFGSTICRFVHQFDREDYD